MPARTYKSKIMASIHENMSDLHEVGLLNDKTMRGFDAACLTTIEELSPASIKRIRARAAVSQAVFAAHLNVTVGLVSKWERGEKHPSGPAAKLLALADRHGISSIA